MSAEVARVAVETALPHLDRLFDFAIPEDLADAAVPGCRVQVRLRGKRATGWIIERGVQGFDGALQPLLKVSGPQVLTDEVRGLVRQVADRYAGTFADVVRSAVPGRVAAVEPLRRAAVPAMCSSPDVSRWEQYGAEGLLQSIGRERRVTASWLAHPHDDAFAMLADLCALSWSRGRSAIVVVPDARDAAAMHEALIAACGKDAVGLISAAASGRLRYRRHLDVLAQAYPIVIGTRSSVFAPVSDIGLICVWDDGDDNLGELHAPGWHAREVAALRAWNNNAALVVGGHTRTAVAAQWVDSEVAHDLQLPRAVARQRRYHVSALTEPERDARRLPAEVFTLSRTALASGSVLVQVPRTGSTTGLICESCWRPLRCPRCHGSVVGAAAPHCRVCRTHVSECTHCHAVSFRETGSGSARSAEDLAAAFRDVLVLRSDADSGVLDAVESGTITVCTPGAEPRATDGFAAVIILDPEVLLVQPSLRSSEEAARRWMSAIRRLAPSGAAFIVAAADQPVVQAFIRNDLAGLAAHELHDRREAGMPPAVRVARIRGTPFAVADWIAQPHAAEVLGPWPEADRSVALLRVPLNQTRTFTRAIAAIQATRSKSRAPVVEVRVDPIDLGL